MKTIIKNLVRESLLNEMAIGNHLFDRLKGRINMLSSDEISDMDKTHLFRYMDILMKLDFNPRKSYAIKLMDLDINPNSKLYLNVGNREYYRLNDFMGRDSTGDEIWVIARNNLAVTIMLRKSIQPESKLRVDTVVHNIGEVQQLIKIGEVR